MKLTKNKNKVKCARIKRWMSDLKNGNYIKIQWKKNYQSLWRENSVWKIETNSVNDEWISKGLLQKDDRRILKVFSVEN